MTNGPTSSAEERLEAALAAIHEALPGATPAQRALLLKRAGDVCVGIGERRKSLGWYGRAVDQYLELGDAEQAALLCRLIIHVQPDAVRARCTLTWIALGAGDHTEAALCLTSYVEAARQAGQIQMAAEQLAWMFDATRSEPMRARIVVAMLKLGETARAEALAVALDGEGAARDPADLWARVLDAAVGTPATGPRSAGAS